VTTRDVLSALLIVVVWGVNFIAIKVGVAEVTPMLLGAMRFAMVLFPAALFVRPPKVPLRLYLAAGIDLRQERLVGLGSVCRRQAGVDIEVIVQRLAGAGLRLHGFGVKTLGLERYADLLASSDSLAWSFRARHDQPLPQCEHKACSSCLRYALAWRERLLGGLEEPRQMRLELVA